jgi:hypothetical protein
MITKMGYKFDEEFLVYRKGNDLVTPGYIELLSNEKFFEFYYEEFKRLKLRNSK